MIGFIKKDIILLKKDILLNLIIFLCVSYLLKNNIGLSAFLISLQVLSMVLITFVEDTKSNFLIYATVLNGKKRVVLSKYYLHIFSLIIVIFLNLCVQVIGNKNFVSDNIISIILISFIISTILFSMIVPFIFKFGRDKGILVLFSVMLFAIVIFSFTTLFIDYKKIEILRKIVNLYSLNYSIYLVISLFIMAISYLVSLNIMESKEF
ncbi:ABC-2 transporter permease [Oceanivirga salmonicida]|uniref:ABC-2 transporter permease n=1 Tax=Oceanivirga salmonicida TaxID=1769291 RepID=UPI0012E113FB|nr:ABC-2 transporter permease [Oceanivirga salmonicida]